MKEQRQPLSLGEMKEMAGQPVYCPDVEAYGIIGYETVGPWAGILFLYFGTGTHFAYNIQKRNLRCYRVGPDISKEFDKR